MATTRQLKRRIQELERQLNELTRRQDQLRASMERDYAQKVHAIETRLQEAINQNNQAVEQEFNRRVDRIREDLLRQMREQSAELQRYDERMQRERNELIAQLNAVNEELAQELRTLQAQQQEHTQQSHREAAQLAERASQQVKVVEALPNEFFCAGQLDVLNEHLEQARTFITQGMCEAAASSADMCLAELQILEINIREQEAEWQRLFSDYRREAITLHQLMSQFEESPVASPEGNFLLKNKGRDRWSCAMYASIRDEVEKHYRLAVGVDKAGSVDAFLKQGSAPHAREIVQDINGLHRLSDQLTAVMTCISHELWFSDERVALADAAEYLLEGQGLSATSRGFRNSDPLDTYVLKLSNNGIDSIQLAFVPERTDGVTQGTLCLVTLDVRTMPGQEHLEKVSQDVVDILTRGYNNKIQVVSEKGPNSELVERQKKGEPDMRLLVRRM